MVKIISNRHKKNVIKTMMKLFNILKQKLTAGNVLTIIASFIFAVVLRHLYLYLFDYLPVRGELGALDLSFFSMVALFRFIFGALLEYLLEDKFFILLFDEGGKEVVQKGKATFSMVNSDAQGSSAESSSKNKSTKEKTSNDKFIDEEDRVSGIMWNVLSEQTNKLLRLYTIRVEKHVEYIEENGGLDVVVPGSMTDNEAEKICKEIGKIDRALQNKFSEYKNLIKKDARLYEGN